MITLQDKPLNSQVSLLLSAPGNVQSTEVSLFKDGTISTLPLAFSGVSSGTDWSLFKVSFTPTSTGTYSIFCSNTKQVLATIEVVTRTAIDYLSNLEDESLGSWTWDKGTGLLTLLRQNGTQLATFSVSDSLTQGSRERLG